jgi:DNA-binding MarR family transcriptional regulator
MNKKSNSKPTLTDTEAKILDFVRVMGFAKEEDIAETFNLHIIDIKNALLELEKKGIVKRVEGSPFGN